MENKKTLKVEYTHTIRIPLQECLFCGAQKTNNHHVIPQSLNPKINVTIPLCDTHKDILHPIVKQVYIPKHIRNKITTLKHQIDVASDVITSLKKHIQFHKHAPTKIVIDPYKQPR